MSSAHPLQPYGPQDTWDGQRRFTIAVPANELALIEQVCPIHGTAAKSVCLILKSICNELRAKHITDYNPEAYFDIIRRRAAEYVAPARPVEDESGGAEGLRSGSAPVEAESGSKGKPRKGNVGRRAKKAKALPD